MSAIFGVVRWDGRPVAREEIERMSETLSHRGVDGSGVWVDGSVGLGHRMLHTTPESLHERQPLYWGEPGLTITADARIDNREEMIAALGLRAQAREGIADSQIILAAYERWGEACPERLIGDFAFAIWDARVRRVFCARDPMGVKPFAYYRTERMFAFSSEVKALFRVPGIRQVIDELQVALFVDEVFDDAESTLYEGIRRLPSAHRMVVSGDTYRHARYWAPSAEQELHCASDEEYAERFREVFHEAVRCRLRSRFPIASALSGGLDSSSITCVARDILARSGERQLHTFSAIFPSLPPEVLPVIDEREFMDAVIAMGGVVSHSVRVDERSPLHDVDRMMWHFDGASIAYNMYIHWALFDAAQLAGCRVLLDGMDGDTTVNHGVGLLFDLMTAARWDAFASEGAALAKNLGTSPNRVLGRYALPYLGTLARSGDWRRLSHGMAQLRTHFGTSYGYLIKGCVANVLRTSAPRSARWLVRRRLEPLTWSAREFADSIRARRLELARGQTANAPRTSRHAHAEAFLRPMDQYGLELCDKAAAAFAVEARYPFYDRRLIEFCVALPMMQRLSQGWTRMILRRAMQGILPSAVQWRPRKQSLSPNFRRGLRTSDRPMIARAVFDASGAVGRYINEPVLWAAFRRLASSDTLKGETPSDERLLYRAAVLARWLQRPSAKQTGPGSAFCFSKSTAWMPRPA